MVHAGPSGSHSAATSANAPAPARLASLPRVLSAKAEGRQVEVKPDEAGTESNAAKVSWDAAAAECGERVVYRGRILQDIVTIEISDTSDDPRDDWEDDWEDEDEAAAPRTPLRGPPAANRPRGRPLARARYRLQKSRPLTRPA